MRSAMAACTWSKIRTRATFRDWAEAGTFHELVKALIDDMHAWYHAPLAELSTAAYMAKNLYAISVFDSIVVLEKRKRNPPLALARGYQGHQGIPPAMSFLDIRRSYKVPDA